MIKRIVVFKPSSSASILTMLFFFSLGAPVTSSVANDEESARELSERLQTVDGPERLSVLGKLQDLGPRAKIATTPLLEIWRRSDGHTDDQVLAAVLDVFRAMGRAGSSAASPLSKFLAHEAEVYWNRDQLEVIRLRSYLMVTLGELGPPANAYPQLLDSLAHLDERVVAMEVGSAARALRSAGRRAKGFIPYLVKVIPKSFADEEFSLERYSVDFPSNEATTAQVEAIRTLAVICRPEDKEPIELLERLAALPDNSRWDERVIHEAKLALGRIQSTMGSPE